MLAILAAVLLAAAPAHDTVFTADGGRILGTVIEDGPQGVTIQAADGTLRHFDARDVAKVVYADGTVTTPRQSPSSPAAPPPSAPAPQATPAPPYVQEPPPQQQPTPPPSAPPAPPPPARAYPPYPPPAYAPPAYPPPYAPPPRYRPAPPPEPAWTRRDTGPISPLYLAVGLGGLSLSGNVESGVSTDRVFEGQLDLFLEGGLRLNPHLGLGLYADIGIGDPSSEVRDTCNTRYGNSCTATTARVGVLLRHTFSPRAPTTPWIAIGTGYEAGTVNLDASSGYSSQELFSYHGWEMLRLMAGIDLRSNQVIGVGLYGGVSFGRYTRVNDAGSQSISDGGHTMIEGGLRFTLFP